MRPRSAAVLLLATVGLVLGGMFVLRRSDSGRRDAVACKGAGREAEHAREERDREHAKEEADRGGKAGAPASDLFAGPREQESGCGERPGGHPESFAELAKANSSMVARTVAPGTQVRTGAYAAAIGERSRLAAAGSAPTGGAEWKPYGDTPLLGNQQEYDQTGGATRLGFVGLAGRTTAFARDDAGHLFAAVSNGGVWRSDAPGGAWTPIGDSLPSQVVSGIGWSSAGGGAGTLIVLTGDNAFGGNTYAGVGAFRSTDGGATWQRATGIPDGVLGFKIAVDPTDPQKVYAATGAGLFRSTDAGGSFANVNLPTGADATGDTPDCTGKAPSEGNCFLANMVTDVVVQGPGSGHGGTPGAVMAAVGWRAGTKRNAAGAMQSPGNGMYTSTTGAPGTFTNVRFGKMSDNVGATDPIDTQDRIGRIALGIADGADQDHRIVYAIVQDAVKFNGGVTGLDVNETQGTTSVAQSDFLNGVWVSDDFGQSWRQLEGSKAIDSDATSGSALSPPVCKTPGVISYCPGVQAWYNLWIAPDPTRSTADGVPTRLSFGLEEVWGGERASGYDATAAGSKFDVFGKYYAGEACTLLNATNGLPVCPTQPSGIPKTTTHPDQHGALYVPDASGGGVTLVVANDGGVYRQHADAGQSFSNDRWGDGDNLGLHTLQPYDAVMAKDGTVYMGLQDNGEAKIEPSGKSYTIYGGDGFFSAVDPGDSKIAYEEYVAGAISSTTDGGKTWKDIQPSGLTGAQFSTPFEMDAGDANHLMIGGRNVFETIDGPGTTSSSWKEVYDLGTRGHPGDASASASSDDPANQLSAVDVRSTPVPGNAPTGPHTPDFSYTGGGSTTPGGVDVLQDGSVFPPGTYDDHPFTVGPDDGDAKADIKVTWADSSNDWDLFVYRNDGGKLTEVGSSASGGTTTEDVVLTNPPAGDYVIRVANYAASGTFDAAVTFTQRTSGDATRSAAYVGFCGYCDTITQGTPFGNGIATNVGLGGPGVPGSGEGWHIANAQGLPSRYITSVRIDPRDVRTVYVTLAGYGRRWAFPGAVGEDTSKVGTGHVFKSTDAGETFRDISGDLPDIPANWTALHAGQLVVGTDIGVFLSDNADGGSYTVLGTGLPTTPVSSVRFKPGDDDLLVAATYGRGVYTYRFPSPDPGPAPAPAGATPAAASGTAGGASAAAAKGASATPSVCASASGFRSVSVAPRGRGLRVSAARRVKPGYTVDVFQQSSGSRVLPQRLVARFTEKRTASFSWAGTRDRRGRPLTDGFYFVRFSVKSAGAGDIRRVALRRSAGRFTRAGDFYATTGCKVLRTAKLSGPAFGGDGHRPLGIAFRLTRSGTARVTVRRGAATVLKKSITNTGRVTRRVELPFRGSRPGDYKVTIVATAGGRTETVRLTSRRL